MKKCVKWAAIFASVVFLAPCQRVLLAQNSSDSEMVVKNSEAAEFHQTPIMPPCFAGALQRINRSNGAAVFLVRVVGNSGCTVPAHWHTSGEQITVVSGTVKVEMQDNKSFELKEGGYAYLPSKHVHVFSCAGPCVHFVQSDGPYDIHYVNKEGKEITLAEALKSPALKNPAQ
jgi:quercetin dioxygenase-like cupin family protein